MTSRGRGRPPTLLLPPFTQHNIIRSSRDFSTPRIATTSARSFSSWNRGRWHLCLSCFLLVVVVPATCRSSRSASSWTGVPSLFPTESCVSSSSWNKDPAFVVVVSSRGRCPHKRNHPEFSSHARTSLPPRTLRTTASPAPRTRTMSLFSSSSKRLDSPSAQRNKAPIWNVLFHHVLFPHLVRTRTTGGDLPSPTPTSSNTPMSTTTATTIRPPRLRVLEIAAGAGVHTDYFAKQWWMAAATTTTTAVPSSSVSSSSPPQQPVATVEVVDADGVSSSSSGTGSSLWLEWVPTDPDSESRESIQACIHEERLQERGVQPPLALTLDQNGIMEPSTVMALTNRRHEQQPPGGGTTTSCWDLILCINMIHISPWAATLGLFKVASEQLDPDHGVLFCYGPYKENGTAVESNL